ncbi:MAG: phosphoglucosamine mutase [Nitrospirae bacterium]|nr:MAG: phosphoglucosamine mutase [Nitrospirota bacterium]
MKLFGTDGIRGRVNEYPLTPETIVRVAMAAAQVLLKKARYRRVLIGKDTRLSGYMIETALTSGFTSMGLDVYLVGPMPTPAIAYLTRTMRMDAGVVVSASHNPFEDNGIKFFGPDGFKLPDETEKEIESLVATDRLKIKMPTAEKVGKAHRIEDAAGRYIEFVKSVIPKGFTLDGLKIVVDCANGAAYRIMPTVLEELGAEVYRIGCSPDGTNINRHCGSTDTTALKEEVLRVGADIGIAHDGDADRAVFVDEKGGLVDGDMVLALWAKEMKKQGTLKGNTVVATVMTNLGIERYLNDRGIKLLRTKVGDRYVVEEMLKGGYNLGGEQSGHIIFFDHQSTGDGPVTAMKMLYLLKQKGRPLSELVSDIFVYPQVLENVRVKDKSVIESPAVKETIKKAEKHLDGRGRVLVRPSGTEPKIRIMVEGVDYEECQGIAKEIAKKIRSVERQR